MFLISDLCGLADTYLESDQVKEIYRAYLFGAEAHEAARVFVSKVKPGPRTERLAAYVAGRREQPIETELRTQFVESDAPKIS